MDNNKRMMYKLIDDNFTTRYYEGKDVKKCVKKVSCSSKHSKADKLMKESEDNDRGRFDIVGSLMPELRDIIFKKLYSNICEEDGNEDFLDLSLVSKTWREMIGNSKVFRNNYSFKYNERNLWNDESSIIESYDFFQNTHRCYKSFKLHHKPADAMLDCFPSTNWKNGNMKDVVFKDIAQYEKFLNIIAPTIKKLSLEDITIEDDCVTTNDEPKYELIFPNLKELTIISVSNDAIKPFLKFHPSLKVVEFDSFHPNPMSIEIIKFNPQIEELKINEEIFSLATVFQEEMCKMKLKSLEINIESNWQTYTAADLHAKDLQEKFKCFLFSQAPTLETLICVNAPEMQIMILELWNDMKHLKKLTIDTFPVKSPFNFTDEDFQLNSNLNLTELSMVFYTLQPEFTYYEEILNNAPNLKTLSIRKVNKEIIFHVARKLKYLKELTCNKMEEDSLESYEQLKNSMWKINEDIRIQQGHF